MGPHSGIRKGKLVKPQPASWLPEQMPAVVKGAVSTGCRLRPWAPTASQLSIHVPPGPFNTLITSRMEKYRLSACMGQVRWQVPGTGRRQACAIAHDSSCIVVTTFSDLHPMSAGHETLWPETLWPEICEACALIPHPAVLCVFRWHQSRLKTCLGAAYAGHCMSPSKGGACLACSPEPVGHCRLVPVNQDGAEGGSAGRLGKRMDVQQMELGCI